MRSYFECADYFKELSEYKVTQLECGEILEPDTMDLMGKTFLEGIFYYSCLSNVSRATYQGI